MSVCAMTSCKAVVQLGHHAAQCYRRIGSLIVLVPLHDTIQSKTDPDPLRVITLFSCAIHRSQMLSSPPRAQNADLQLPHTGTVLSA